MSVNVMCSPKMKAHSLPHIQQNPAAEYSACVQLHWQVHTDVMNTFKMLSCWVSITLSCSASIHSNSNFAGGARSLVVIASNRCILLQN